jgi:hypothetical protein
MFNQILAHEGPLLVKNPKYKGSSYNLLIEWDSEELTWELLNIIAADDKVTCALYGKANNMLDKKGWKYLKKAAKNIQKVYTHVQETTKHKCHTWINTLTNVTPTMVTEGGKMQINWKSTCWTLSRHLMTMADSPMTYLRASVTKGISIST